jgi:hypothetical protein
MPWFASRPISATACSCISPIRPAPAEAGLDGIKEIEITVADGVTLVAWHEPAKDDKPTILYFHAANAANRAPRIETIRENGFGVFYLNVGEDAGLSFFAGRITRSPGGTALPPCRGLWC